MAIRFKCFNKKLSIYFYLFIKNKLKLREPKLSKAPTTSYLTLAPLFHTHLLSLLVVVCAWGALHVS